MAQDVVVRVDGAPGAHGRDGADGSNGWSGGDGGRGENASPAKRGQDAGQIALKLRSSAGDPRSSADAVEIKGQVQLPGGTPSPQGFNQQLTWDAFGSLVVSARGGRGGDGGRGGNGGRGGDGRDGSDATRSSSGGNGGRGGDGGDGGLGSDGADGGKGGLIRLEMALPDTYLLMAVADSEAPVDLVEGGKGGRCGAHGRGGSGGSGGRGGSSYSWTETETYRDSQGNTQTRTTHHSNPGGSSGFSGSSGHSPTAPLHPGQNAPNGLFEIHVRDAASGQLQIYAARYDLAHDYFSYHEAQSLDADDIFEPGEWVDVRGFVARNIGKMPTPPMQRVRLILGASQWIWPAQDELFITKSLGPGEVVAVEGVLRFQIPRPQIVKPGAPFVGHDQVIPQAWQLGVEPPGVSAALTPFQRRYQHFACALPLETRFPLQNLDGVRVLRSLAPGERSRLVFAVENISAKDIGAQSQRGRRVMVQIERAGGEVLAERLVFLTLGGERLDLSAIQNPQLGPGYWVELACVPAKNSVLVEAEIGFEQDVEPYTSAVVWCTIWLESMDRNGQLEIVQRREAVLRVEPGYKRTPDARFLLVTHNNVSREGYKAWRALISPDGGLPLGADDWSISRYGHFDHEAVLPDEMNLRAHLEDRVVVVLNAPFNPRDDASQDLPTNYVRGSDFRESTTTNNTAFVIIGSGDFHFEQWLEPTSDARMGGDDFPSIDRFLVKEQGTGGALVQDIFREDITTFFDVVTVEAWALPVLRPKKKAFKKLIEGLAQKLAELYPSRRYVLVYRPEPDPVPIAKAFGIIPRYRFGTVEVRRSLDRDRSDAVLVTCDPRSINSPEFIDGDLSRLALMMALSFDHKLELLDHFLRLKSGLSPKLKKTLALLVDALMVDLAEEQAALRRSRHPLTDAVFKERLSYLERLREHPFTKVPAVKSAQWEALVRVVAGLESLAREAVWWWQLWGRQRNISDYVLGVARWLRSELFAKQSVDDEGNTTATPEQIDAAIKADCAETHASIQKTRHALSLWVRLTRRSENALAYFLYPAGDKIVREADCWTDPRSRIWHADELTRAIQAEQRRLSAQAALRQHNADIRARMLTASSADQDPPQEIQEDAEAEIEVQATTHRRSASI